jgi:hypothetical protein
MVGRTSRPKHKGVSTKCEDEAACLVPTHRSALRRGGLRFLAAAALGLGRGQCLGGADRLGRLHRGGLDRHLPGLPRVLVAYTPLVQPQTWRAAAEVEALLQQFPTSSNDRPRQGLGIPGLSPNQFADRILLM